MSQTPTPPTFPTNAPVDDPGEYGQAPQYGRTTGPRVIATALQNPKNIVVPKPGAPNP